MLLLPSHKTIINCFVQQSASNDGVNFRLPSFSIGVKTPTIYTNKSFHKKRLTSSSESLKFKNVK